MALDEPSAQLYLDIRKDIQTALATRRPVIHHLNADTSWFLQIPRPEEEVHNHSRLYYNILIDPWLTGGQSDVASWFSQQFHATPSAVQTIAELEELAREIEIFASGLRLGARRKSNGAVLSEQGKIESFIDAVVVSHEFSDHCHKDTLHEVHPDVPVFAIKEAAKLISSWKHFRSIITVHSFGEHGNMDWRTTSVSPMPNWLGISRLLQMDDVLNYHAALMICFNNHGDQIDRNPVAKSKGSLKGQGKRQRSNNPGAHKDAAEAIVYTPHGIHSADLALIPKGSPPIKTLAFLHGLHNVRVGTASGRTALQSNLGAHNGLQAQRILKAKHWISTHDEIKKGGGLVAWFLQRDVISLKEALDQEREAKEAGAGESDGVEEKLLDAFDGTNWAELANGESRVLV